jgi:hypothetical protein
MGNAGINNDHNGINGIEDDDDEDRGRYLSIIFTTYTDRSSLVNNGIDNDGETLPKFECVYQKLIKTVIFKEPFAVDAYEVIRNLWDTCLPSGLHDVKRQSDCGHRPRRPQLPQNVKVQ